MKNSCQNNLQFIEGKWLSNAISAINNITYNLCWGPQMYTKCTVNLLFTFTEVVNVHTYVYVMADYYQLRSQFIYDNIIKF